jgi:hypothetical protein
MTYVNASVSVSTTENIIPAVYAVPEKRLLRRGAHVSSTARQPSTDRDMFGRNQTFRLHHVLN